ncbi:DUF4125 family protein [Uliginosibacterium gangwonense]|uniref:DUF4125 family protein n=1 Tax=Uliginosibacterium gangwonense TaxID=392736 RepID=UPI0003798FBD|nr:DUF4125 family protein [Uliginosibacterium gangwonense]
MTRIDEIIALEWGFFDKVQNEGGRANCQDDFETFQIMRKSQFLCWDDATTESYLADLRDAKELGRNLIQEKYARMMASTAPSQYAIFVHTLPALSPWQLASIEAVITQQLMWREAFAVSHPQMSSQARLIHTAEDTPYETSFETYLRGELGTYSEQTLRAYQNMILDYAKAGKNITTETMNQTAKLYGYPDLDTAERMLRETS